MDAIIIGFVVAAVSFYIGYKYHEAMMLNQLIKAIVKGKAREMAEMDDDIIEKDDSSLKHLVYEEHNGVHLFYYEGDNNFACQGNTLDEAAENFQKNNKSGVIGLFTLPSDGDTYVFMNGKFLEAEMVE